MVKRCEQCRYWRQSSGAGGVCSFDEITRTETAASFGCADYKEREEEDACG